MIADEGRALSALTRTGKRMAVITARAMTMMGRYADLLTRILASSLTLSGAPMTGGIGDYAGDLQVAFAEHRGVLDGSAVIFSRCNFEIHHQIGHEDHVPRVRRSAGGYRHSGWGIGKAGGSHYVGALSREFGPGVA